ncbi:HAD family hydrolase [Sandarakinorhabdus sp.]|uniref:HAD family hydrolase n=1 Tax=Sandarakinorhabdus sp. TaxID=1916663 RepID=UPI00286DB56D|nr:HAD family hydrolase [Sandarakinorhabdus sp.]
MTRPLIISDCDGVLLEFIAPFIAYLDSAHGLTLRLDSFALTGNVRHADGTPVAPERFPPLLDGFFTTHMNTQMPVPGAVHALATLARDCDIVVLTNIADHHAQVRTAELARLGMPFRVIGNHGPKGAPIKALLDEFQPSRAVFIDDLPPHHTSARGQVPHVHRLHMVAEHALRTLIPAAPDADARIDDWPDALVHIQTILKG